MLQEVVEPYILDSIPDVLSIGRRCVEDGYAFHWEPYSLAPTMITPQGKIVALVSRDCCPYLDDYDPDYVNPAVVATPITVKHVTWDPAFATEDSPALAESHTAKTRSDLSVLTEGAKRTRWSDLTEEENEDEYEGLLVTDFSDPYNYSPNDEQEWGDEVIDYTHWDSFAIDPSRRENLSPAVGPLPNGRLSALPGVDNTWEVTRKFDPEPLELTPKGLYDIYGYVSDVVAAGTEHFVDRDVWDQVCLLAGVFQQKTDVCRSATSQAPRLPSYVCCLPSNCR
jgi:hypothetical protein